MPKPLYVLLDMDGLMLDTEPISLSAWRAAAAELGYVLDDGICEAMVGRPATANVVQLRDHFGDDFPGDALLVAANERYRRLLEAGGVPHKAGLEDFLRFLDARSIPRAVATSTATSLAREKLTRAGVLGFFDVVVGGDLVARGKPAPDIFLAAAARLGAAPADCVVLEDSGPGVLAAAAAGMRPILIPDGRGPGPEVRSAAAAVVESLHDAARLIDRWLGIH